MAVARKNQYQKAAWHSEEAHQKKRHTLFMLETQTEKDNF